MKRNVLLIATICLSTMAVAEDQKNNQVPVADSLQSQTAIARNSGDDATARNMPASVNCDSNAKQATANNVQHKPEGDPDAPQNQVEYGGGS